MSTSTQQILPPEFGRPHVVILGAGASRAAFPKGNRHGIEVPLMNDVIETLDLKPLLAGCGLDSLDGDFEMLYSELATSGKRPDVLAELEHRVSAYFASLKLPDEPTLYDHLVLSLRPKDLIATFNWDPFLWQALSRNSKLAQMPISLYLHGNVTVAYCTNHKPATQGWPRNRCGRCGARLEPSRLLYPVTKKDYTADSNIEISWREVQNSLKAAFILTIFGYRAPATDVEAFRLLKEGWGLPEQRELEQIEIINTAEPEELEATWKPLFCREHYTIHRSFYNSLAAEHPRRSCEDVWEAIMQCNPQPERVFPRDAGWDGLRDWFRNLIRQEELHAASESESQGAGRAD